MMHLFLTTCAVIQQIFACQFVPLVILGIKNKTCSPSSMGMTGWFIFFSYFLSLFFFKDNTSNLKPIKQIVLTISKFAVRTKI